LCITNLPYFLTPSLSCLALAHMINSKYDHLGRQSPISNGKSVLCNLTHFVGQVLSNFPKIVKSLGGIRGC
jgi:hypothetical protein